MSHLPTGTVTFLFTDIEGSTRLIQHLGDSRSEKVFADYRRLLCDAVNAAGGHVYEDQGESFLFVFQRARDAVLAGIATQRALVGHSWPESTALRVRMGLHTGEPVGTGEGYVGVDVHKVARICRAGHGGQILISQATSDLVKDDLPSGVGLLDLGEYRLKDLARPQPLFQVVVAGLREEFPPLRSLSALPNNLPILLTSFIGREREIAEVKRLLAATRLLTLTGAGGSGKTRLALQLAGDLVEEYPDGVWWVDLASLTDPALVPQTVASVLGIRELAEHPLTETLTGFLRFKSLLLVLDNCEHLLAACTELAHLLLRSCQRLRVLATSRAALRIAGETRWPIPSLTLPELHQPLPVEHLMQWEAVRLFIERATAAFPGFKVTNQNAQVVAQVCRRLDGIPLAIELAATLVRVLGVEQIARRLDDRFRLLTGGSRTAPPRHQTLRAAIESSYDPLSEKERLLFRRLSVFAGNFALDAAEAVCAGEGLEGPEVLDILTQLVDNSLVAVDEANGEIRYRLLEMIRHYGRDRLLESGEAATARSRHRDFFSTLAERAEPHLRGPDQAAWLQQLEMEHDNLRTALEWSVEIGEGEFALRLAGALRQFWLVRGYYHEGRRWFEEVLKRSGSASPALRGKALAGAGYLATYQGDHPEALSLLEESLTTRRQIGDREGIADSLYGLGRVAWRQQDFPRAVGLYREALAQFEELGAQDSVAMVLNSLGLVTGNQGDYGTARSLLEKSLAIRRRLGDKRGIALTGGNLAVFALHQGDYVVARALAREGLAIDRELRDARGSISDLEELGLLAAAQGQAARAARLLGAADALRANIGAPLSPSEHAFYDYDHHVAGIAAALGQEAFTAAWAEGRAMTLEQAIKYAMEDAG